MINFLQNLKLSLTQWLWLTTAAAIGLLVTALKIQGSRLHKAQIDSLMSGINSRNVAEDSNIEKLRDKMAAEIDAYEKAQ